MAEFTHFDAQGQARMVDVSDKSESLRVAIAAGEVHMQPETLRLIREGKHKKGDVLGVAQVAAITGAKQTAQLIPMCHPLGLDGVEVQFQLIDDPPHVDIRVTVKVTGKTGVEMEALTGVTTAALTIYDMCKAVDRGMTIGGVRLLEKTGGRSGHWVRD